MTTIGDERFVVFPNTQRWFSAQRADQLEVCTPSERHHFNRDGKELAENVDELGFIHGNYVPLGGSRHDLLPEEILISTKARRGYAIAEDSGYIIGVTTDVSPDLVDEGLVRELVHRLQTMRRSAGFDIADYIETYYQGGATIQRVMMKFATYIKQETLSRELKAKAQGTKEEEGEEVMWFWLKLLLVTIVMFVLLYWTYL